MRLVVPLNCESLHTPLPDFLVGSMSINAEEGGLGKTSSRPFFACIDRCSHPLDYAALELWKSVLGMYDIVIEVLRPLLLIVRYFSVENLFRGCLVRLWAFTPGQSQQRARHQNEYRVAYTRSMKLPLARYSGELDQDAVVVSWVSLDNSTDLSSAQWCPNSLYV